MTSATKSGGSDIRIAEKKLKGQNIPLFVYFFVVVLFSLIENFEGSYFKGNESITMTFSLSCTVCIVV